MQELVMNAKIFTAVITRISVQTAFFPGKWAFFNPGNVLNGQDIQLFLKFFHPLSLVDVLKSLKTTPVSIPILTCFLKRESLSLSCDPLSCFFLLPAVQFVGHNMPF
jgi:hypothetical protein